MQLYPNALWAACSVNVNAGVPELAGSSGPVVSVSDLGVGRYRVVLRQPGIPYFADRSATLIPGVIASSFGSATAAANSAYEIDVSTFNAAGAAADISFALLVFQNTATRNVVPPPEPEFWPYYRDGDDTGVWNLDDFYADLVIDGFDPLDWVPPVPNLPVTTTELVINEATAADTRAAFMAARNTPGQRIIIETTMEGAGDINLWNTVDLDIICGPDVYIDGMAISLFDGSTATRVRIRGGEWGPIQDAFGFSEDLLFQGMVISSNRQALGQPDGAFVWEGAAAVGTRLAITDCVVRGNVNGPSLAGYAMLVGPAIPGGQWVSANCRFMGKPLGSGAGNWAFRSGLTDGVYNIDCWEAAELSFVDRDAFRIARYATLAKRGTAQQSMLHNAFTAPGSTGNMWATAIGGAGYARSLRAYMEPQGTWDPNPGLPPAECVHRDVEWNTSDAATFSMADLIAREALAGGNRWSLTNGATFVYSGTGTAPAIPAAGPINSYALAEVNAIRPGWYPGNEPRASFSGVTQPCSDPQDLILPP